MERTSLPSCSHNERAVLNKTEFTLNDGVKLFVKNWVSGSGTMIVNESSSEGAVPMLYVLCIVFLELLGTV